MSLPRVVLGRPVPGAVDALPLGPPAFHAALPGYAPTPLVACPAVARAAGVRRVLLKDESARFGLPAFKYLGASWAIARTLGGPADLAGLAAAARRLGVRRLTAATDGNHGRAVARLAAQLGLEATIHVPEAMVEARRAAIAGEGAEVVVVAGGYDAAVRAAAAEADDHACRVIADADHDGRSPVPAWVVEGYATLFSEVDDALARDGARVDVAALQLGVGAFAAAGVRWATGAGVRPFGAEPVGAPCIAASLAAGRPVEVETPGTVMAGLDAGQPSIAAWPALEAALAGVVLVTDEEAEGAVRLLAEEGLTIGESGAAGVAGLLALAHDPQAATLRDRLGWHGDATVLAVGTEGHTGGICSYGCNISHGSLA